MKEYISVGASILGYINKARENKMEPKKTVLIDFDGVLHRYNSGWQGAAICSDLPVEGAMYWLLELIKSDKFRICIYSSSRSSQENGIEAMKQWLRIHLDAYYELFYFPGFPEQLTMEFIDGNIEFPKEKPPAFVTIDDRCICFDGNEFPSIEQISGFIPWYLKPEHDQSDL